MGHTDADADADVVVIGAGVVGLAIAAAVARSGRSVLILEADEGIGRGVTSRNSEVIHAGIYYPQDSLKAELCVRGRELLYPYCAERSVPHRKLGKLIVAGSEPEIETLASLQAKGRANGVPGLEFVPESKLREMEPAIDVVAAIFSPETGICDAHTLCLAYLAEAEAHEAILLLHHRVVSLQPCAVGWRIEAQLGEGERQRVEASCVVNAAGLASDRIAALAGIDVENAGLRIHPCKGDYFSLAPSSGVHLNHLVYPVPVAAGLGTHATLDLGGRIRFGPDTEYVDAMDFDVDAAKAEEFARAVQRYLPSLRAEQLTPDYAGIRPKLAGPGEGFRDFVVREESGLGAPGLIDCVGIESPGLTAAGAIAERVCRLL